MNHPATNHPDLSQFAQALFKALELGLLIDEPQRIQALVKIHSILEHEFLTKLWLKYRPIAARVYREHFLLGASHG